jgi:hypothetical protein
MHAHGDLRLLAIPAERPLADQQANEQAAVEVAEIAHARRSTKPAHLVSPSRKT